MASTKYQRMSLKPANSKIIVAIILWYVAISGSVN